eukprot:TRINITY_DN75532_c0_g1_i1.p1 TRINITY_DN75532_c0_g1~~TRINITY_DN75532_c0_g1_i1.p1  ORF type:complete len:279 (-),score=33.51 TRINITY_DN75532_c0_g1_i1:45-881(-)
MGANCQSVETPNGKEVIVNASTSATVQGLGSRCASVILAQKEEPKCMTDQRLLVAARNDDITGIQLAIQEGAYLETRRPFVMRPWQSSSSWTSNDAGAKRRKAPREGLTPLMYVAQNGSVEGTTLLITSRARVSAREEDGMRPLHFAAQSGVLEICRILLENGADKDAETNDGNRAIDFVSESCFLLPGERGEWEALLGTSSAEGADCRGTACEAPDDPSSPSGNVAMTCITPPSVDLLALDTPLVCSGDVDVAACDELRRTLPYESNLNAAHVSSHA